MTPEERALAAAFLAECWAVVREVPSHIRAEKRKDDRAGQRWLEDLAADQASTGYPHNSTACAQPCAQIGSEEVPETFVNGAEDVRELASRPQRSTPGRGAEDTSAPRGLAS